MLTCCGLIPAANCVWSTSGRQVTLCGWVDTYRDHSGVLFIDLRDRYGKTQVVFAPEGGDETAARPPKSLRSEFVVLVRGKVAPRPEGTVNPKLRHRRDRSPRRAPGDPQQQPHAALPADRPRNCPARTCG